MNLCDQHPDQEIDSQDPGVPLMAPPVIPSPRVTNILTQHRNLLFSLNYTP